MRGVGGDGGGGHGGEGGGGHNLVPVRGDSVWRDRFALAEQATGMQVRAQLSCPVKCRLSAVRGAVSHIMSRTPPDHIQYNISMKNSGDPQPYGCLPFEYSFAQSITA